MDRISDGEYPPETVKDWMLKLVLDMKLKLQSRQITRSAYTADTLHKEIIDIDSLSEMKAWLFEHLRAVVDWTGKASASNLRPEVAEACKYVSLHLDKRISLEEVSDHLFLNPSYFSRLFKKEMGETFIEYITRMKMERAKELLDQTTHSVGKICELLGYDNQSYFIKIFKTHSGVTPLEYRG
ncbi:helix-turn-helix transcriptional regulator [Paenibacillus hexagrammi]|uniref:helix-turn-helix transcriptional regulator n=1 Tax=Paenibacillus hexagrammi TaxID=2908839 RepID=UPI00288350B3|nr:helix-turn-helix transcriptional regulator [Paenibacillus sp. YPD9-1]